jgi:hypothetical protein
MPSVTHGVLWLFIQTSHYNGPVFGLGPCDTGVRVSSCGCVLCTVYWLCTVYCILCTGCVLCTDCILYTGCVLYTVY